MTAGRLGVLGTALLRGLLTGMARQDRDARLALPPEAAGTLQGDAGQRGRQAASPHEIPRSGWRDILLRTYEQIGIDRVLAVAAGMTFYALLATFPAVTALVSVYGLFADPATVTEHLDMLAGVLPAGGLEIVGEQMERIAMQPSQALGFGFVFGLALAAWSSNQGMKAMFDALNVAYHEREKRSFLRLNLITLTFTLAIIVLGLSALAAIVVLPVALDLLDIGSFADVALRFVRWPVLLVAIAVIISVLYRIGPSRRPARWRWITPGSVLATLVWMAASIGFSWYAESFGTYNETYGSLGAAIAFMTWIWVSATIVLVGAELNSEIERQTLVDSTAGAEQPMGRREAVVADDLGPSP